jgi:hypothetical protein
MLRRLECSERKKLQSEMARRRKEEKGKPREPSEGGTSNSKVRTPLMVEPRLIFAYGRVVVLLPSISIAEEAAKNEMEAIQERRKLMKEERKEGRKEREKKKEEEEEELPHRNISTEKYSHRWFFPFFFHPLL